LLCFLGLKSSIISFCCRSTLAASQQDRIPPRSYSVWAHAYLIHFLASLSRPSLIAKSIIFTTSLCISLMTGSFLLNRIVGHLCIIYRAVVHSLPTSFHFVGYIRLLKYRYLFLASSSGDPFIRFIAYILSATSSIWNGSGPRLVSSLFLSSTIFFWAWSFCPLLGVVFGPLYSCFCSSCIMISFLLCDAGC